MPIWDLLCNIETGKVTVNKDIRPAGPPPSLFPAPPSLLPRTGTVRSESTFEDDAPQGVAPAPRKEAKDKEFVAKTDNPDNLFMEDVRLCLVVFTCPFPFLTILSRSYLLLRSIMEKALFGQDSQSMLLVLYALPRGMRRNT